MRYDTMTFKDAISVCHNLIQSNYSETGEGGTMSLDSELYTAIDGMNKSFVIVAFDDERPVGLCAVFVARAPHRDAYTATNDTIFVDAVYRNTHVPGRIFLLAEKEAKKRGCYKFQWDVPPASALAQALSRRCTYRAESIIYSKEL